MTQRSGQSDGNVFPVPLQKIAVFRALQLGDLLCAVPAVRALRMAFPDAEITLLGLPWAGAFIQRFSPYFDRFIHFPGYPGLPEQEYNDAAFTRFSEEMQAEQFDLLLQMQGNGTIVNDMLQSFGALHIAGFYNEDCFTGDPFFLEYPGQLHEIERHLALMRHLGIASAGKDLEFIFKEQDYRDLGKLQLPIEPGRYICIHPGSRGSRRQWPPQYFALLANLCAERGFDLVITGTTAETAIIRELIKWIKHPVTDLTGITSLGALGLLIANAALLIANCTGVSHIAAALQTPSLIISMDGEPRRWAPLNHLLHHTIDWTQHPPLGSVVLQLEELLEGIKYRPG